MIQAPRRPQANFPIKPAAARPGARRCGAPPARARQVLDDSYLQGPAARQAPSFDADSKAGERAKVRVACRSPAGRAQRPQGPAH
jgi:hypothetical protein